MDESEIRTKPVDLDRKIREEKNNFEFVVK